MRIILLVISCLLSSACTPNQNVNENILPVILAGPNDQEIVVNVEIADSPEERSQGLMFREHLGEDEGMLFVLDQPQELSFWMKNTKIPLDILFFDAAGQFISHQTMQPCEEDPCQTYPSKGRAKYALEVNAGYVQEKGIGEGWTLVWQKAGTLQR